jgi:hypothetical protein
LLTMASTAVLMAVGAWETLVPSHAVKTKA